jgi:hypothetical protein
MYVWYIIIKCNPGDRWSAGLKLNLNRVLFWIILMVDLVKYVFPNMLNLIDLTKPNWLDRVNSWRVMVF